MALFLVLMFGMANFALHRAVLESGHQLLDRTRWFQLLGGKFSLTLEFAMLLGAALLVGQGAQGWAWFYALYSAVNAASAWLILSGRI